MTNGITAKVEEIWREEKAPMSRRRQLEVWNERQEEEEGKDEPLWVAHAFSVMQSGKQHKVDFSV